MCKIFRGNIGGRQAQPALAELWRRLADTKAALRQREHLGSVGAQLCFWGRSLSDAASTAFENRFEESTARWESDLQQLKAAGIELEGWHGSAA